MAEHDEDRDAILLRRRRFLATALLGLTAAGCGASTTPGDPDAGDGAPQACLRVAPDTGVVDDANPQPCLGAPAPDVSPVDATDATPTPCLDIAFTDGGTG